MSTLPGHPLPPADDPLDQAVRHRLAKLSHMPLDTGNLDRALRAQIPAPVPAQWRRVVRPLAAVAAGLIVVAAGLLAMLSSKPALAASDMAQMHRDIVAGKTTVMPVDSMDEAAKAFAAFAGGSVSGPNGMPAMGCCMQNVAGKKVFCILLNNGGTKVTMAIADSADCQALQGTPEVRGTTTYYVQAIQELNMVSFDEQGHRVCLIGAMPGEKLMELTDGLKF